jgi:hypothetical protein
MNPVVALTENEIAQYLARYVFPCRRYLCVPNSNQFLAWEADLLVMAPSFWLYEVEIKSTVADLRRDMKKQKHNFVHGSISRLLIRKMYYAMPLHVFDRVRDAPPIPEHAGIITINPEEEHKSNQAERVREAVPNPYARKLNERERFKLARLGALRYWLRNAA